ncbi:MAG: thiolase family protein [Arenicella sp.]|jgi:acetyl-CoA acyltransferase|nr:thiolase family protein [Arenicella sp.]
MSDVFIVDAVRTPIGRYRGSLASVRADHLSAHLLGALVERNQINAQDVNDVVMGCVTQVGEQSANIARLSALGAGWPDSVPGLTIDRKCGSGEVAVHVASGLISAGSGAMMVAGGAENMSRVKMGGNREIYGEAYGWMAEQQYELTGQGEAAERMIDQWQLTRTALDEFTVSSHQRADHAQKNGFFNREIVAVPIHQLQEKEWECDTPETLLHDETIRPGSNVEKLATLKPSFREDGRITAGNSSQISDGAALLLLASQQACENRNLVPRARIVSFTSVGSDPTLMLTGPIAATRKVLQQAGLSIDEIDLFEVNEAFAPVPLVWMQEMGVSHDKLNVNGGAIALGHPLGASGARIMTSMLNELERRGARYGLQAICCNGGIGTATIIERL